jgi:hypothetical protein
MLVKFALASAVFVIGLPLPIQAHDIYSRLKDPWGNSCCDDRECHSAAYRFISGHWQMFVDERWIDVPDHTIQYRALLGDTGETNGGHWCGSADRRFESDGLGDLFYTTRCAILPPKDTSARIDHLGILGQ